MNHLKSPHEFSRGCAQRDDGVCPLVISLAHAPVIVRACAAGWNETKSFSGSAESVDQALAPPVRGLVRSAQGIGFHVQRNFPVSRVEGADNTAPCVNLPIVRNRRANDHQVLTESGSGGDLITAGSFRGRRCILAKIHFAPRPEVNAT